MLAKKPNPPSWPPRPRSARPTGRYHTLQICTLQRGMRKIRAHLLETIEEQWQAEVIHGQSPAPVEPTEDTSSISSTTRPEGARARQGRTFFSPLPQHARLFRDGSGAKISPGMSGSTHRKVRFLVSRSLAAGSPPSMKKLFSEEVMQ